MDEGTPGPRESVWRYAQAAAALLIGAAFVYTAGASFGDFAPLILLALLIAALTPFRGMPGYALWLSSVAAIGLYWFLYTTGSLIAPFVLAFGLAYVLDPVVDRIQTRVAGRSAAIAILLVPVLAALVLLVVFALPMLGRQLNELVDSLPELANRVAGLRDGLAGFVGGIALPGLDSAALARNIRELDGSTIMAALEVEEGDLWSWIVGGVVGVGRGLGTVATVASYVVLTPVLTFYLLRDYDAITDRVRRLIPRSHVDAVASFASEFDTLLGQYLRGQLTVAVVLGVYTSVGLLIFGFPYAFLLGFLMAAFNVVPFIGIILAIIPALAVALLSGNIGGSLLAMAVVYGSAQVLDGSVVSPKIVGDSVGLHPVWIVLALSLGGFFLGFVGFLIAVPLAVGIKLVVVRGVAAYQDSAVYKGAD